MVALLKQPQVAALSAAILSACALFSCNRDGGGGNDATRASDQKVLNDIYRGLKHPERGSRKGYGWRTED